MPKGKIIKALSGFYYCLTENKEVYQCRGRGVFRKNKITPLVGDEVIFQIENGKEGYMLEIKGRKNQLIRPPIANVDQALLVFSAVEPDFSSILLDRFLVLIEFHGIKPIICITKMDLVQDEKIEEMNDYIRLYQEIGYDVFPISSITKKGIENILPFLEGKITVLAGQSGVGKSSLLNAMKPELNLETKEISNHLGRGKHTTRHVELIEIGNGLVADTPGFSSLEFSEIEAEDLSRCFPEFLRASEYCKFRGCFHIKEPQCYIKQLVAEGKIALSRYSHYEQFLQEIRDRKPRY